jgi:hypothetical protein
MRANFITAAVAAIAAFAMNSVLDKPISGAGLWLGIHAPALMVRILSQDSSCVRTPVRACAWLGAMLLVTAIVGAARR